MPNAATPTPHEIVFRLLEQVGIDGAFGFNRLDFVGTEPCLPARHRIVRASACAIGAQASAVGALWKQATGVAQQASVNLQHAALALRPGRLQLQSGYPMDPHAIVNEPVNGFFQCADGRWVFLVGSYPHLRNGLLRVLDCANTKNAVAHAVSRWRGEALEDALAAERLTGAMVRAPQEWLAHPQGRMLSQEPVIAIEKLGDAPRQALPCRKRPLDGLRVLDLTHVIAGPVLSRTLAEQGADVLHISAPLLPDPLPMIMDTGIGKRSAYLALDNAADRSRLRELVRDADVFVQSWRPGSMERLGFGPHEVARIRPGIIYVSVSAFGLDGPWAARGGFDQIAQSVTGIASTEGGSDAPRLVPTYLMNDYLCAYLGATGVIGALLQRAEYGGGHHVNVSLARTSMWVQGLGLSTAGAQDEPEFLPEAEQRFLEKRASPFGELTQLRAAGQLSQTPPYWVLPPEPLGASRAGWQA